MVISKKQGDDGAEFVRQLRPSWDQPLLAQVITELSEQDPYPDVIAAAMRGAVNPEIKSPLALKWPDNLPVVKVAASGTYAHEPRCDICKLRKTRCRYIAERTGDHHLFTAEDDTPRDPDVSAADWVDMIKDLVKRPA
jgi:hypothetical protein